jgi:DNA-binding NarL/FixJ family response regulator
MVCDYIIIAIHPDIQRKGLCAIIREHSPDCTIQTAIKESDLIDLFKVHSQAICLFSASSINSEIGIFLGKLHKINPYKKTVLMVPDGDTNKIEAALRAGVNGIFTELCTSEDFLKIMTEVASGKNSYSSAVSDSVMINYHKRHSQRPKPKKHITKRESEILNLIVKGYTSVEIAEKLFISPRTVETHRCNLMGKLKLKNTAELVRFALQEKE